MVGREGEQAELAAFLAAAGGQALVLRGETGVGKTSLLGHAASMAEQEGSVVIRAVGVEAESELPYAGLHQFLHPLLADVARLDEGTRAVFDAVFGRAEGDPPSVMRLGIAVLSLLSLTAERQPLLVVLDDGQWLDDSSADVCGFVGRRLVGSSVRLLVAVRTDIASRFDTAALPELSVSALSEEDAACLLDRRYPRLGRQIRRAVLEQARGNPLALLELAAHLGDRASDQALDDFAGQHGVPLPRRLQQLYGARIAALGDRVRAELLMGALDGVGTEPGGGPAHGTRYRMREADEAVAAGLLDIEPATDDFTFRHPLVRSAVVRMATPNQRRAAHRALAQVHRENLERRATHLAAATIDPDEEVAGILEAAAESATRRGGALSAVTWLTRAAESSENHADRSRRLADAAFVAGHAARLGEQAEDRHPDQQQLGRCPGTQAESDPQRALLHRRQPVEMRQQRGTQALQARVGEVGLGFDTVRTDGSHPLRPLGHVVQQRRFADARLAPQHQHPAPPVAHLTQQTVQRLQLAVPPEQLVSRVPHHVLSSGACPVQDPPPGGASPHPTNIAPRPRSIRW
nr:ATP-binding protein [Streptomyces shenzhenensis]